MARRTTTAWRSTCCNDLQAQEQQLCSWQLSTETGAALPSPATSSCARPSTTTPAPTPRAPTAWRTCSSSSQLRGAVWRAGTGVSWWGSNTASVAPTSVANKSCEKKWIKVSWNKVTIFWKKVIILNSKKFWRKLILSTELIWLFHKPVLWKSDEK